MAATRTGVNCPALNVQQIRFVDAIIKYPTVNGALTPERYFSPPFSDISPSRLIDVFNPEQSAEMVSLLDRVNDNAVVA
jgi:hypothetical protein